MCVIFEHSKVVKILPRCWQQGYRESDGRTHNIRSNKIHKMFYSHDENAIPNFEFPLSTVFEEFEDRCYAGFILKIDGKLDIFRAYMCIFYS